jgi:hypothetical protein
MFDGFYPEPDWADWASRRSWRLYQAVPLLLRIDPDRIVGRWVRIFAKGAVAAPLPAIYQEYLAVV